MSARKILIFAAITASTILGVAGLPGGARASGDGATPAAQDWSFKGPFGVFDQAQLQRGFQVYNQVCAACHSLQYVAYRHLDALGYSAEEIKAIAALKQVEDGPDDQGDMFVRPARPEDFFVPPFANENQARASNGGALPPDLSLITKARIHGPDYIYALLIGFEDPSEDIEIASGMSYNKYFPGNQIAMFAPLFDGAVEYADGSPTTIDQLAADVTAFLVWTAEPELVDRKRIGFKVLLFLLILAGLLYAAKRRVWSDLH